MHANLNFADAVLKCVGLKAFVLIESEFIKLASDARLRNRRSTDQILFLESVFLAYKYTKCLFLNSDMDQVFCRDQNHHQDNGVPDQYLVIFSKSISTLDINIKCSN